jgi:hypothetical protein
MKLAIRLRDCQLRPCQISARFIPWGHFFPVLRAMSHSAVGECDFFCRLNELNKYRDKIGLDDGVIGLSLSLSLCVCVCVEKCICCLSNFRDTCFETTYKALKLSSKLAICKHCWKCICLFGLITNVRKGLRRARTANERCLRGGKPRISAGDARRPL